MRKAIIVALVGGGLAIGGTAIASAGEPAAPGSGIERDAGGPANGAQAADMVLRQAGGGRTMGVEPVEVDGREAYRVTVRNGSGTFAVTVDAETGRMSGFPGGGQQGGGQQGGGQQGGFPGGGQQGGQQGGGQQGGFPGGGQQGGGQQGGGQQGGAPGGGQQGGGQQGGGQQGGGQQGGGEYQWSWDFGGGGNGEPSREGTTPSK
jgi:hypothetical protein